MEGNENEGFERIEDEPERIEIKCKKCGRENHPDAKYCNQCATPLIPIPKKVGKICPKCGGITDYNPKYDRWWCWNCRYYLPSSQPQYQSPSITPTQTPPVQVQQRQDSYGWVVVLIIVIVLVVVGVILLQSGVFKGGFFACGAGTMLTSIPLFSLPFLLRKKRGG